MAAFTTGPSFVGDVGGELLAWAGSWPLSPLLPGAAKLTPLLCSDGRLDSTRELSTLAIGREMRHIDEHVGRIRAERALGGQRPWMRSLSPNEAVKVNANAFQ